MTKWMIKKSPGSRAHVWTGTDTLCEIVGAFKPNEFKIVEDREKHEICFTCSRLMKSDGEE